MARSGTRPPTTSRIPLPDFPSPPLILCDLRLRIHRIERAPQRLQAAFGGAEYSERVRVVLVREPSAPGGAVAHVRFLMHAEIGERARFRDVVETPQPGYFLRGDLRHLRFVRVK